MKKNLIRDWMLPGALVLGISSYLVYHFTPAAKIVFDYEIRDTKDNALLTSARTIQAFTDQRYELILENPEFYLRWKRSHFDEE